MVVINGEKVQAQGKTIGQYIEEAGYSKDRVVVEINMEIIPKDKLDSIILNEGDSVEILNFVGGG